MKKALLIVFGLFIMSNFASAQYVAQFESGTDGFADNGWGPNLVSVTQASDPTGKSSGVLKIEYDGNKGDKGCIQKDGVDALGAQVLTYYLYLPANTPDSLVVKVWGQDNANWSWTEQKYFAKDLAKEKWYPVSFFMEQYRIKDGKFDVKKNKIGKMGIEFSAGNAAAKAWTGTIYVDNVALVGVVPTTFTSFNGSLNGLGNLWGNATVSLTDTGAAKIEQNLTAADSKGAFGFQSATSVAGQNMVAYWVYVPASAPNDLLFKIFAQDNSAWSWNENKVMSGDIVRDKWFPIYFDLKSASFDADAVKLGKFGVEVNRGASDWNGAIFVTDVQFISPVQKQWVVADFEKVSAGTQGFTAPGWANASLGLERATVDGRNVLKANVDYKSATPEKKVALQKDNIILTLKNAEGTIDTAAGIQLDIFLPADFPVGGNVDVVMRDKDSWGWIKTTYPVKASGNADSTVIPGKWATISWKLADHASDFAGKDFSKNFEFDLELKGNDASEFQGSYYIDNLTVLGLVKPSSPVSSPVTSAVVAVTDYPKPFQFVDLTWEDNELGTETYNVYRSESPITDLKADGVVRVASNIPHGAQRWANRPFTKEGWERTYYYAVTAFDGAEETPLNDKCKVGPVTIKTSATVKIAYDPDFATKFALDGQNTEFEDYSRFQLAPENASDPTNTWTPESEDINFHMTFVTDGKYLYMSGDVTDDDLRNDPMMEAWQGDAFECYIGFYDASKLKEMHTIGTSMTNGDWRIGFLATGKPALDGGPATTIKGLQSAVAQNFGGDGYVIEARIELDSVTVKGQQFTAPVGSLLPFKIDVNDNDPSAPGWDPTNNGGRSMIAQFGTSGPEIDQSWKRPDAWGFMEVVAKDYVDAVDEQASTLPTKYSLYNNYPNPFNPSTVIKYDIPQASMVTLKVFDVLGREVATLVNGEHKAGSYQVAFNARNFASGTYIYRIQAGNFVQTKKMVLVK